MLERRSKATGTRIEMEKPSIIFIIGTPASGKSTICEMIIKHLDLTDEQYISIDKAHRLICKKGQKSWRYTYKDDGSLILHDRDNIIHESFKLIQKNIESKISQMSKMPILIEFSHINYAQVFSLYFNNSLPCAHIIHVITSKNTAYMRNNKRPPQQRVPSEYMDQAFDEQDFSELKHISKAWIEIENYESLSMSSLNRIIFDNLF